MGNTKMSIPARCYYSVVRYVPDDLREEAVNIGVLLDAGANSDGCLVAFVDSATRAASIDPSLDKAAVDKIIQSYRARLTEQAQSQRLSELVRHYCGGRIQLTAPRLSLTDDPVAELADLKQQFVVESGPVREFGHTESRLRHDLREALELELDHLPKNVIRFAHRGKPQLYAGKTDSHEFDLVLSSPAKTDLVRCITFDVKGYSEKVDAAKVLAFDAQDIKDANQSSAVDVLSVLYPPKLYINGNVNAFHTAEAILKSQGIGTFNFSKPSDRKGFVEIAKKRLAEAQA